MAVDHYENFPVASILLPRPLREPVEAIYAFARSADDIADEGDASPETRIAQLDRYRHELDLIEQRKTPSIALFARLAAAIYQYELPIGLLRDLLDAFSQDVVKIRYADFAELCDYCRRSANPVGRLLLRLYQKDRGITGDDNLRRSDAICTSLQLINFWQDVAIDWTKRRIYLPQDDMARFNIDETHLRMQQSTPQWQALMRFQVERSRAMMLEGAPLAHRLEGRIGLELRLVVQGGLRILQRIEQADYDVFSKRPKLGKRDWLIVALRALAM